ncbi:hypothetical protein RND71_043904 [Anisodus tanguticus]|uniref:PH domain-containing protein n=1 Tax=Anisodus tanguticus TaxID=243964 RepID=A0AAE1QN81_9SOLA|nr:hypothetical protein RND71_043904 [Anisodus tanguticus]
MSLEAQAAVKSNKLTSAYRSNRSTFEPETATLFNAAVLFDEITQKPLDGHFDFSNKPTGQLYSCLSNENSISNLSIGEQSFVNGIPSISNNLANNIYSSNPNTELLNINNPLHSNQQPVYEYNLAEIALLDNQRAQQYIQQQKARHQLNISANQIERLKSNGNHSHQETSCTNLEIDEDKPPPLPPLPSQHLLKRSNYPCDIYRVNHSIPPPQYSDTNFIDSGLNSLYSNLSHPNQNPPQYSLAAIHQTDFDQEADNNLNLNDRFDGQVQNFDILPDNTVLENIVNKNSSLNFSHHQHRHHLPHHRNQNSIFTSMDGLRVQIARTKKQMAAVANSVQINSNQNQNVNNSNSFNNTSTVSSAAQSIVAGLVTNQPIRAPTIQRSAEMQVSLKGWLYRLEGAGLKQWKRRWFVLGEYCLFYYKDAQEQKTLGSVLLPSYTVTACSTSIDGITRKFSFKLEHHNTKTHYLAAECAESMHQWMTLIGLSATMQLNSSNYEQLKDGTVTAALTAANISRNRPDSQDMMNLILNRTMNINGNNLANQENNKNFNNSSEMNLCRNDQLMNANLSLNNQIQNKSSSTLDHSMMTMDDNQLNESESDCGFSSYKPNRQSKTSNDLDPLNQMNAEKYSYNSIGLPSTSSLNYSLKSSQRSNKQMLNLSETNSFQHLPVLDNSKMQNSNLPPINGAKRSHYVNAPPKPRRHQTNLQNSQNVNNDNDFESYPNGTNASLYGTNQNHFSPSSNCNLEQVSKNIPDLIDAQRSQSSTPMSTQQNRFAPITPPLPSNLITSEIVQSINSSNQSSNQNQINNSLYNNQYDEHAQSSSNRNFRSGSPDYMNIDFFRQNQCFAKTNSDDFVVKSENLMQKFDFNLEQQENIYQSVLSKNARLEIESLKNEVAKQELLKKQKILRVEENEVSIKENDTKLSEYQQDYIPPPLNLNARSIMNRDNSKNKSLSSDLKLELDKNDEEIIEKSDDASDDFEISPKPFSRSQFRRSFMNAVSIHKSPKMTASYHASHAYCGPLDDFQPENNNLDLKENIDSENQDNLTEKNDNIEFLDNVEGEVNLTMQQRRDQLQRLLYSNSMTDINNLKEIENKSEIILKPPRSINANLKTSIKTSSSSDSVRAMPAIIVETPEKNNETNNLLNQKQVKENLRQKAKKILEFDLVEPLVAQKPPRNSIKKDIILDQNSAECKKQSEIDLETNSSSLKSSLSSLKEKSSLENIDKIDSVFSPSTTYSNSVAPYYYSDLLSEKQKLELNTKLNEGEINPPPPLLSRCNSLNNSRFLGVTSLQKISSKNSEKNNLYEDELAINLKDSEEKINEFNDKIVYDEKENFKFQENKTDNSKQSNIDDNLLPSELSQLLLDSALIIYEQLKPPKRSTGSSVSSERSITDEQSDDDKVTHQTPEHLFFGHKN